MREKGIVTGLSLTLIFMAFLLRDWFLSYSIIQIKDENIFFEESWKSPNQVFPMFIFALSFVILPFLQLFVKKICKLTSLKKQIISTCIIITSGLTFYVLRVIYLKYITEQINDLLQRAEFATENDVPRIRLEDMYLEFYLLAGLIVGSLLTILIYRRKDSKNPKIRR